MPKRVPVGALFFAIVAGVAEAHFAGGVLLEMIVIFSIVFLFRWKIFQMHNGYTVPLQGERGHTLVKYADHHSLTLTLHN